MGSNTSSALRSLKRLLSVSFSVLILAGCTSTRTISKNQHYDQSYLWTDISDWAKYTNFSDPSIPLIWHCIQIDLTKKVQLSAYPEAEDQLFKGITVSSLSKQRPASIIINTSPYSGRFFQKRTICGIHKINGKTFSPEASRYSALTFTADSAGTLKAGIISNQDNVLTSECDSVFGGFFTILKEGVIQSFSYESHDSRTACGISKDGKTLFVLVAEGERRFSSKGLSYPECAEILLKMGCYSALEMDGGGSSCLYVNGRNMLNYSVHRKNAAYICFENYYE